MLQRRQKHFCDILNGLQAGHMIQSDEQVCNSCKVKKDYLIVLTICMTLLSTTRKHSDYSFATAHSKRLQDINVTPF